MRSLYHAALEQKAVVCDAVCELVLPGPEAAARAAAAASNKKRKEAEAGIADAVARALHMLGSLKQVMALLAGQNCLPFTPSHKESGLKLSRHKL